MIGSEAPVAVDGWEQLPAGWSHRDVSDVAVDSHDRVYVLNRGEHPVIVYDRDGGFLAAWGEGVFQGPHGITIGPDDAVLCADNGDHTVRRFTTDGTLLQTIGTPGAPSDTGYDGQDHLSVARGGPPFHRPTKACVLSSGAFYVTDGYGNARVHRFSPAGELEASWGEPGEGRGQFRLPHGLAVTPDERRLLVCDRENDRVQVFDLEGRFLDAWTGLARPAAVALSPDGHVHVAELGRAPAPSRCSTFDAGGRLLMRWGAFFAAHGIAVDARGDVYVAEITWAAGGGTQGHTLQKFHVS